MNQSTTTIPPMDMSQLDYAQDDPVLRLVRRTLTGAALGAAAGGGVAWATEADESADSEDVMERVTTGAAKGAVMGAGAVLAASGAAGLMRALNGPLATAAGLAAGAGAAWAIWRTLEEAEGEARPVELKPDALAELLLHQVDERE